MLNYYKAEEGKVWKHIETDVILSNELYLGVQDSIDNYVQVDEVSDDQQNEEITD